MPVDTNSLRYLPRRSSKNCSLLTVNCDSHTGRFYYNIFITLILFSFTSRAFTDDDDPMPSCDCYDDSQEGIDDEMPEHFHFHSSESGQMFSHFDDMFRSFDELFRSMGMTQFSAVEPGE